jgi:hypothetical protein
MESKPAKAGPLGVFQGKFDSLHEVVQTVYVDAGEHEYKVEVQKHHHNSATAPMYVIRYFVKRGNQFVDDDTALPWADGRTRESALASALSFISERHPRKSRTA